MVFVSRVDMGESGAIEAVSGDLERKGNVLVIQVTL